MDNDTQQLLFNDVVPLPFRVLLLVQLGVALWYILNRVMTSSSHINVLSLLNLGYSQSNYNTNDGSKAGELAVTVPADYNENVFLQRGIWNNLIVVCGVNFCCWAGFKLGEAVVNDVYIRWIPAVAFAYTAHHLFGPGNGKQYGQVRAFTTIKRVLRAGINSISMRSNDILLSDSLISYAKVINDVGLFVWVYYLPTSKPYLATLEIVLLSLPTFIRIKQCLFEYRLSSKKLHLANMAKYALGLVPLALSYAIKLGLLDDSDATDGAHTLTYYWYVALAVNATYLLFWDIRMDWGLNIFDKLWYGAGPTLRPNITYPLWCYYAAMVIDGCFRFLWLLRLVVVEENQVTMMLAMLNFLFGYDAYLAGYMVLEVLEILRRWMWCFLKLESDWVKVSLTGDLELGEVKAS